MTQLLLKTQLSIKVMIAIFPPRFSSASIRVHGLTPKPVQETVNQHPIR